MNTCGTCAHWHQENRGLFMPVKQIGKCKKAQPIWNVTDWSDAGTRELLPGYEERKMFVEDGSDYYAALLTTPDFGCTEWEAQP